MSNIIIYIISLGVAVLIIGIVYYFTVKKQEELSKDSAFLAGKSVKYSRVYNLYTTFNNFSLTHKFIARLRFQFETVAPDDEKFVKGKTVKIALTIWISAAIALLAVLLFKPTLYWFVCAGVTIYVFSSMFITQQYEKCQTTLSNEFNKFLSELRHNYFNHGMLDEAIYETLPKLPSLIKLHAMKFYKVLSSDFIEEAVLKYNQTAPNNLMKRFIAICNITTKYGDPVVDGMPLFLVNLKNLRNDNNDEVLSRRKLNNAFKMTASVAVIPIFMIEPIRKWAIKQIADLEPFYASSTGILMMLGAFVVSVACYLAICRMKYPKGIDTSDHALISLLSNVKAISKILNNVEARYYSFMRRLARTLKRTGSNMNARQYVLRSAIYFLTAFLSVCALVTVLNRYQRQYSMSDFGTVANNVSGSSEQDDIVMMILTSHVANVEKDFDAVAYYNKNVASSDEQMVSGYNDAVQTAWADKIEEDLKAGVYADVTEEEVLAQIHKYNSMHKNTSKLYTLYYGDNLTTLDDSDLSQHKAIKEKNAIVSLVTGEDPLTADTFYESVALQSISHIRTYQTSIFYWYFILIALAVGVLAFALPFIMLTFDTKELQQAMEDEVIQFQSVILGLMYHDRMSAIEIIDNLIPFATVFQSSLQKCRNKIDMDEIGALEELKAAEPFEPFVRLVDNLIAVDRIGVLEAFNELDVEQKSYSETRKQENAERLENMGALANSVAFIPMGYVIFVYMVIPFIVKSMASMTSSMSAMSSM